MNPEIVADEALEDLKQKGREFQLTARMRAEDALAEAEYYVRRNPWIALGGAVLAGAVLVALIPRNRPAPPAGKLQAVCDWLDETRTAIAERMPDRDDVRSTVRSSGLPGFLEGLGKKLRRI